MSSLEVLDPTGERQPADRQRLPRPATIEGRRVLDRLEQLLAERGAKTERFRKPTFARPAPRALLEEISARSDLVVEALAD